MIQIGDIVKVFSSTSEYDGQTGRVVLIGSAPGAPAPYVVRFGDAITEPFSEREIVPLKPIESLWLSAPLETCNAPHGASPRAQQYIGRIIAQRFIRSERRRLLGREQTYLRMGVINDEEARRETLKVLGGEIARLRLMGAGSPCIQCGKLWELHT